ncbi:MAG: FAD-dependent oxidoreductase, partial [Victivallales bacterium]|nr:FAD-dependent oxidoreductase [Victivallales bacterium]
MSYSIGNGIVTESAKELRIAGKYDVLVVGGGVAGVGAGIAAARHGCKTLIVEQTAALGGLTTVGLVNIPLDLSLVGIGKEMLSRLDACKGHWHRNTDPEKHKLILDRMVRESGCDLLLVSFAVDAIVENDTIKGVVIESKSGREVILADRVIDATGDADVAYYAGAECFSGRASDGKHQACSLQFRLGGVDWDAYINSELKAKDPSWMELIQRSVENGEMPYMIENHLNWVTHVPGRPEHCGKDEVSMCIAHSRNCNPLSARDLTRMYQEGREQVDILSKFIKRNVPGFQDSYLIDTGLLLGVRESRRIVGEYVLKTLDFARGERFPDAVTETSHHYDLHNPDGPGNIKWAEEIIDGKVCYVSSNGAKGSWPPPGGYENMTDGWGRKGAERQFRKNPCDIPYRTLIPIKLDNLIAAGRCLSSEFMAQAASRLIL